MATVPQPGPPQQQPPQQRPDPSPQPLSWEGDKMFNIYIYDYCFKRGYRKTAQELMNEADIAPDSTPPINARQGLLFEWWSVFWVLFSAKANGNGTEEAMLYTQHQANQLLQRQASQRLPPGPALPPGQQPQPGMPHQQPPPMTRLNGVPSRPGMMGLLPNGNMPNGVGPPGSMPPGGPNTFSMAGGHQPNGMPGQPGPPPPPGGLPTPVQNFQLLPGQRPSISNGMPQQQPSQQPPQQQRGPNGPFQSPNMASSPQNTPGGPQPSQQQLQQHLQQQQHPQPPMGQLGGPSPHLSHLGRGGMLPPNQGMNPMNPQQGPPGGQQQAPPPGSQYQPPLARSPSRAGTPGQGQMMQPSPSLTNRQVPGGPPQMAGGMPMSDDEMNRQILMLPQANMAVVKAHLGMENKELPMLNSQDKQRILSTYRARFPPQNKPGGPPDNAAAGPSNQMMQPPNQQQRNSLQQRNLQQPLTPQQQQQQQQQQQRVKRNSTSPGEEHDNLPRSESSPPDRKRLRRSPMEQPAVPPMPYTHNPPPLPHQMIGGPQGMVMMRGPQGNMPMNGGAGPHPGQSPMQGGMGIGPGGGMGMSMGGPHGQMGHQQTLTPHMASQQMAARQQMMQHMQPKGPQGQPGGGMGGMPGNAGSPPSGDPSTFNMGPGFNTGPNRMGQKTMMPPPSPAMNGPPKDQQQQQQQGGPPNGAKGPSNMQANHGSPRPGQTPNGTGPPTPVPQQQPNQGGPGLGMGGQNMAPSPSAILGGPPQSMGGDIFSTDFIQNIASSLDDFPQNMDLFRPDGDINFERDFGQWFNPDDTLNNSLDIK